MTQRQAPPGLVPAPPKEEEEKEVRPVPPGLTRLMEDREDVPIVKVDEEGNTVHVTTPSFVPPQNRERKKPEGIWNRIEGRFLGTDVDDPLPFARMTGVVSGAVAGGTAGSKVPMVPGPAGLFVNPIVGTLAGGALGAIAGGLLPEQFMELGEMAGFFPEGTRAQYGLNEEDLIHLVENEALLDLATGGTMLGLRLTGRGLSNAMTGISRQDRKLAEELGMLGIDLLPVQMGGREIARGFVGVMGRFPAVGGPIRKRAQAAEDALRARIEDIPARMRPLVDSGRLGETIFNDAKTLFKGINDDFSQRFEKLFDDADRIGVRVDPLITMQKAIQVRSKILSETPSTPSGGHAAPSDMKKDTLRFIDEHILPMFDPDSGVLAEQSLRQMDGLVGNIDEHMARLTARDPEGAGFVLGLLGQLRVAAQTDMNTQAFSRVALPSASGEEVRIVRELDELNKEFSFVMNQIFETTVGQRIGRVSRSGLRERAFDKPTGQPIDQLASMVVRLESPQMIDELSRIVPKNTMQRISAQVLQDAVESSYVTGPNGVRQLDADKFGAALGLIKGHDARRRSVERLMDFSEHYSMKDLETLHEGAQVLSRSEIPNVNTFMARRATLAGAEGIMGGLIPGIAAASGASFVGGFMGLATFIGGSRLVGTIISNPDSARALRTVMDKEASRANRRRAAVQVMRLGIEALDAANELSKGEDGRPIFNAEQLKALARSAVIELDRHWDEKSGFFKIRVQTEEREEPEEVEQSGQTDRHGRPLPAGPEFEEIVLGEGQ